MFFIENSCIVITRRKIRLIGIRVLFRKTFSYLYRGEIIFLGFVGLTLIAIEIARIVITLRQIRLIGIGVLFHKTFSYLYRGEIIFFGFFRLILRFIQYSQQII